MIHGCLLFIYAFELQYRTLISTFDVEQFYKVTLIGIFSSFSIDVHEWQKNDNELQRATLILNSIAHIVNYFLFVL